MRFDLLTGIMLITLELMTYDFFILLLRERSIELLMSSTLSYI